MTMDQSLLRFDVAGHARDGATLSWQITERVGGAPVGWIQWGAPRAESYCLVTYAGLVLDPPRLREIAAFMEVRTREHREAVPLVTDRGFQASAAGPDRA